jgi:type IV fimbrial biogenesis protein FimT
MKWQFQRQAGFTVTELMVVTAIVAILLGLGVPSFRYITNSYRMSAEVNGLLGDLMYARAEAIREGQTVTVCISNNGTSCAGAGGNWANGWIVFSDPNNNKIVDAGETVLRTQAAFTGAVRDTFNASGNLNAITYNREGFATTAAGFPNTTITLHDQTSSANWTRCLWITPVGTLTIETPSNNLSGTCS